MPCIAACPPLCSAQVAAKKKEDLLVTAAEAEAATALVAVVWRSPAAGPMPTSH